MQQQLGVGQFQSELLLHCVCNVEYVVIVMRENFTAYFTEDWYCGFCVFL